MKRTDLATDPHFLALDALLNGPAYKYRADHCRQVLVDWLKACEPERDPLDKKFPEGFDDFDDDTAELPPVPWWVRFWAWFKWNWLTW